MKPMKQQKTFSISITRQFNIIMSAFLVLALGIALCGTYIYAGFLRDQQKNRQIYDAVCSGLESLPDNMTRRNPHIADIAVYGTDGAFDALSDSRGLLSPAKPLFVLLLLQTVLIAALAFFLFFLLYRPLVSSLKQLKKHMQSLASGDRQQVKGPVRLHQGRISFRETEELELLSQTVFDTHTRMYELESSNRLTEIAFLRSQAIPHILHNTLTTICGMAAEGMTDKIISVASALSQIFRYSIKGSDLVTLREEIEIVKSYVMIQKERFGERFTVRYTFLDDSEDCLIPRMIIQPLVENAIVHGIESALHPCELIIGAGHNPEHGYLAIWVYDNGVGMSREKLEELQAELAAVPGSAAGEANFQTQKPRSGTRGSIGLKNVNTRMILYYGTDYSLLIDSEENKGTNIQLRVPHLTKQEESHVPGDNHR